MLRSVLGTTLRTSSLLRNTHGARLFASIRPLGPKNPAPPFKGNAVVNGEIKEISYADYTGSGRWVILFFYPLDFTFVCPTEIIAFNDRSDEFAALNTQLIACSCDSHFSHLAWIQTPRKEGGLGEMKVGNATQRERTRKTFQIPVLADFNKKIASDFGVLDEGAGLSYRGLFLIDPKGVIRHCVVNDLPVGRSVDETLRTLKAFQYFEKHGEVCPADWEEDQPSINTTSPKEYFSKVNK